MLRVLTLFLIPAGGGIPAGVLLARKLGLWWPVTAGIYFASDLMLAVAFEPLLRGLAALSRRIRFLKRAGDILTHVMERVAAQYGGGRHAGPFTLIMIAFGVDPMTGRAAAMAAGHGFIAGWAIAIAGDMIYYFVIAFSTLKLDDYFDDPRTSMFIVLGAMILAPLLVRRLKLAYSKR